MFIQGMKRQSPLPSHVIDEEIHQIIASSSSSTSPSSEFPSHPINGDHILPRPALQQQQQQFLQPHHPHHPLALASIPLTSRSDPNPRQLLPLNDDLDDDDGGEEDMISVQSARQPMPPTSQMPSVRYQRSQYSY
jgi:hypothetical protein